MENLNKLCHCFENIGILVEDIDKSENLMDFIEDSLTFITFIVEVENIFEIEIPDEYLLPGKLVSIQDVLEMVGNLKTGVNSNML